VLRIMDDSITLSAPDASENDASNTAKQPLGSITNIASPPHGKLSPQNANRKLALQEVAKMLMPTHRIRICLRHTRPGSQAVEIVRDRQSGDPHFTNLMTCGRLWVCPVCAARITEQRAVELLLGVSKWHAEGGFVAMLTFTMQHDRNDDLGALLDDLRASYRKFCSGAPFQRMKDRYGWVGSISALEVTHGSNGWHPHLHVLGFFEPMASSTWREFIAKAKSRWVTVLMGHDRSATLAAGLDVKTAETSIYDYVAKFGRLPEETSNWTLEREMVKAPSKLSRGRGGRTPFELLAAVGEGDKYAGALFREYADVFEGRNQLSWSAGLRDMLGMNDEKTDEELAAALPDEYDVLVSIPVAGWRELMRLPRDVRGTLLVTAIEGGRPALLLLLRRLGIRAD
jgi:hypothetical protein